MRRIISSLLVLLLCIQLLPALSAGAAPRYKVKETRVDDVWYYSVYSSSAEKEDTHFFTHIYNVFTSANGKMKLTMYEPMSFSSDAQAQALADYLQKQSREKRHCSGWYRQVSRDGTVYRWVYLIEGWDPSQSISDLIDKGRYWKDLSRECLMIQSAGDGDVRTSLNSYIYGALEASFAVWFPQSSPHEGVTAAFIFYRNAFTDEVMRCFCVDENRHED